MQCDAKRYTLEGPVWLADGELPLNGWQQFGIAAPALTALLWVLWQWIKRERDACATTVRELREAHSEQLKDLRAEHDRHLEYERALRHETQVRLDTVRRDYDLLQEKIRDKYVDGLRDAYHGVTEAHELVQHLREELRQRTP